MVVSGLYPMQADSQPHNATPTIPINTTPPMIPYAPIMS
jgi:hypothetical protein